MPFGVLRLVQPHHRPKSLSPLIPNRDASVRPVDRPVATVGQAERVLPSVDHHDAVSIGASGVR
jgi:hypothetical protein